MFAQGASIDQRNAFGVRWGYKADVQGGQRSRIAVHVGGSRKRLPFHAHELGGARQVTANSQFALEAHSSVQRAHFQQLGHHGLSQ